MSEESKRLKRYVMESVVGGDLDSLGLNLARLSRVDPSEYIAITAQLIDTNLPKQVHMICIGSTPEFVHADGVVYVAVFADAPMPSMFTRNAHPSGIGLALQDVQRVVAEARSQYDDAVLKKALNLKDSMAELDSLLEGHSAVDHSLASFARADLAKGQALLIAALTTNK